MKYTIATFLGLATIASAQLAPRYTPAAGTDECTVQYDSCRYAYEANHATCAANYAECLGYNPFTTTTSTASSTWPAPVTDSTYPAVTPPAAVNCGETFTACLKSNETDDAVCASQFAACQGENPYSSNGTASVTGGVPVTVTEVVSSFTTYCPAPTTLTAGGKTYTVTSATTLTITDCPCTLIKTTTAGVPAVTNSANPWTNTTLTTIGGSTKTGTGSSSTSTGGSKNGTTTGTAPKSSVSVFEGVATANTVGAMSFMALFGAAALMI